MIRLPISSSSCTVFPPMRSTYSVKTSQPQSLLHRHPIAAYFLLTFTLSWLAALAVAAPHLLRHETLPKLTAILMFPGMLVGPLVSGLLLTRLVDGPGALAALARRMNPVRLAPRWYAVLLIPPALVLLVLALLKTFISPAFAPNLFLFGVFFGIPAGFIEEIGWTGFAFPKMRFSFNALPASILLGLLWSLWHLPVIDYLGAASPHGPYLLRFFLAFTLAMTAMRVLISWAYTHTESLLLAQLLHVSSTGSLVVFGPPAVSPAQESLWYAAYAAALSLLALLLVIHFPPHRRST